MVSSTPSADRPTEAQSTDIEHRARTARDGAAEVHFAVDGLDGDGRLGVGAQYLFRPLALLHQLRHALRALAHVHAAADLGVRLRREVLCSTAGARRQQGGKASVRAVSRRCRRAAAEIRRTPRVSRRSRAGAAAIRRHGARAGAIGVHRGRCARDLEQTLLRLRRPEASAAAARVSPRVAGRTCEHRVQRFAAGGVVPGQRLDLVLAIRFGLSALFGLP